MVASDAAAQSDLYSAVTLAGVVGTDCIVLAGPRDQPMPADQQARLAVAAAGGSIVGGEAAVPAAKLSSAEHAKARTRIAGTDRWHTAVLVGIEAIKLADSASLSTADASAGAEDPTTDCTGDMPIVAASDPAAESDRYSAVTLAGVIGTDCVILAGPRGQPIPADQQARLAAAAAGGYIVGGDTAVPPAKLAGRTMTRLAGTDRWATARLVGQEAINTANNNPTPPTLQTAPNTAAEPDILREAIVFSVEGGRAACALTSDGDAKCTWFAGSAGPQMFDMPDGPYASIHPLSHVGTCGLRTDGTAACWRFTGDWVSDENRSRSRYEARLEKVKTPEGTFTAVHHDDWATVCGLRTDRTIACWGLHDEAAASATVTDAPDDTFDTDQPIQFHGDVACGFRADGTITCWGDNDSPSVTNAPDGAFTSLVMWRNGCGIRTDGAIACWGDNDSPAVTNAPDGAFDTISHNASYLYVWCGIRTDGTITCWGDTDHPFFTDALVTDAPTGSFDTDQPIQFHWDVACGFRADGTISCWGDNGSPAVTDAPSGAFTSLTVFLGHVCGLGSEGTVVCSGDGIPELFGQESAVSPPYLAFSSFGYRACVLDAHGGFDCVDYNVYEG